MLCSHCALCKLITAINWDQAFFGFKGPYAHNSIAAKGTSSRLCMKMGEVVANQSWLDPSGHNQAKLLSSELWSRVVWCQTRWRRPEDILYSPLWHPQASHNQNKVDSSFDEVLLLKWNTTEAYTLFPCLFVLQSMSGLAIKVMFCFRATIFLFLHSDFISMSIYIPRGTR
jgi:hypothetical protein